MNAESKPEEKKLLEDVIKERIIALEEEREKFTMDANMQVAAYNGAIAELKKLIEPETVKNEPEV